MPFIHPNEMKTNERLPGWHGRFWRSENNTFSHYTIDAGSSIHEHHHPYEEAWLVIEGELEITVAGEIQKAGPGCVAIVPLEALHSVRALTSSVAVVTTYPVRHEFL